MQPSAPNGSLPVTPREPETTGVLPQSHLQVSASSRRQWIKRIAAAAGSVKGVKEGLSAAVCLTTGATAGARFLSGIFNTTPDQLERSDFLLHDLTTIQFELASPYDIYVIVKRHFQQTATKTGRYYYRIACLGEWEHH